MGRVDQFRSYYTIGRTGRKWWRYIFFNLFNIAIINYFIIYKKTTNQNIGLLSFKHVLYFKMMNNFNLRKPANTVPMDVMSGIPLQHKLQKFTSRICVQFKKDGIKTKSGNQIKTIFHCKLCNV